MIAAMISAVAFGNNTKVPDNVSTAFSNKFPGAEDVNWKKEFNKFEVEFTQKNETIIALFSKDGSWIETATYIDVEDLPAKTIKEIELYYEKGFISSIRKAVDFRKNNFYRVTVETGEAFYFLKVDEEGDIIDTSVRYKSQLAEE